jgi:glycopeptide antibiotics resistance protein
MTAPGRRLHARLLACWCAFMVYGSFLPFRLDVQSVSLKLSGLQWWPFQRGAKNFSMPDVLANLLLFAPFGLLLAGALASRHRAVRLLRVGAAAFAFAVALETGQLVAADRVASGIDVLSNVAGALIGAALATRGLADVTAGTPAIVARLRRDPAILGIALVVAYLVGQSFYPFAVTLDVGTVVRNLRSGQWSPFAFGDRRWAAVAVDRVVPFALLAVLLGSAARDRLRRHRTAVLVAALGASALALEMGKVFIAGRTPSMPNVVLALPGIAAGALLVPHASIVASTPALVGLSTAALVHGALTPFSLEASAERLAQQVARIEWLPLASYAYAPPQRALFDAWDKLLRSGWLGFALARAGARSGRVTMIGIIAALVLEALQLLTVDRLASVTDVLLLTAGAWLGARIHASVAPTGVQPGLRPDTHGRSPDRTTR